MQRPLKVLINAQMPPGGLWGGAEQFLMALVHALGRMPDGDEQYVLITSPESPDWLNPFLGPNQKTVVAPRPMTGRWERAKRLLGPFRGPAGKLLRRVRGHASGGLDLPQSDGFYESLGGDIIHFPYQWLIRCGLPAIYNPWDLQHVHFPQFFSKKEVSFRDAYSRAACNSAQAVATGSMAVKLDLQRQYALDAQKIFVIHCGPPAVLYGDTTERTLREVRERFCLPDSFALFPAQTWPHKNHLRLLEAIRVIRDCNGVQVNLVCTGTKNDHWPTIRRRIDQFDLQTNAFFLGYVSPLELRALYRAARFVVYPSLFEGAGLPVLEALQEGAPVICSDLPPLREYGGEAVLTFDPNSTESMVSSLLRISLDADLREQLRARGKERARTFTWERAAKTYRALYRKVAGVPSSEEDLQLLAGSIGIQREEGR